jgi:aspartyl-tRNA(Asn)/glutamyl-tRNA(Gln) amidotransferase subunit A
MTPAATGTDTAGSLRIPSALAGTSTIKPTRGLVSLRGIVPLAPSLDTAGPMARSLEDCALLLRGLAGPDAGRAVTSLAAPLPDRLVGRPLSGLWLAVSPRAASVALDADMAEAFDAAVSLAGRLGATVVDLPPPTGATLDLGTDFLDVLRAELAVYHRRFEDRRERYRPSLREWVESGERHPVTAEGYAAAQDRRRATTVAWADWLAEHRLFGLLEPTVPVVAPQRGDGYDRAGSDYELISLTHYWNWTGAPVVSLPMGIGRRSGLPVGVSIIGPAASDWSLLEAGVALQRELGVPSPPLL